MDASDDSPDLTAAENAEEPKDGAEENPSKKPGSKAQGRKRTKSGCLTCRKRRIKCGEERPTCQNCTKSKRQCEGYSQRVVFKDPLSAYRPSWAGTSQMSFPGRGGPRASNSGSSQPAHPPANPPPIAPKPARSSAINGTDASQRPLQSPPGQTAAGEHQFYVFPNQNPSDPSELNVPSRSQSQSTETTQSQNTLDEDRNYPSIQQSHIDSNPPTKLDARKSVVSPVQLSPLDWTTVQSTGSQQFVNEVFYDPNRQFLRQPSLSQHDSVNAEWGPPKPRPESFQSDQLDANQPVIQESPIMRELDPAQGIPVKAAPVLSSYEPDLMEEDDDDPFDISDDEDFVMEELPPAQMFSGARQQDHFRNNNLGIVAALQANQDNQALRMRSVRDFIDRDNMLATYAPPLQSTPLQDPMAARLFCHFVNVTAPIISMFERHPANPSLIFQGHPIPKSQQHIWTYVFPALALQNSALLHAMLALASLHVSQLQNAPVTKSLKHYHVSLRRVAKSLSLPSQRGKPATLAAAMLLAFYECWCADHQKWINHLLGSKHLLQQIDFAKISKHIKLSRRRKREQERAQVLEQRRQTGSAFVDERAHYQSYVDDVDENIVGMLMGSKLRYDETGQVLDDNDNDYDEETVYTEKDLEVYEVQRDLYWWYAKQDVYQSILGGGKLFLDYDLWSQCPPRAPIGRLNATYGTYDHTMLLLARVADFASKDLMRKRRAAKANGGWRPPESMRGPPPGRQPPGGPGSRGPQGPPQMPQMPPFSGMVPTSGHAKLPMGFGEYHAPSPESPSSSSGELDLEAERLEAEEEWQEIRNMFAVLADHFGEDFQPLGPEFSAPIQTPFGTAHQYRTYGIAGIWMNYYMGLIACHRAHPSMPPAAMIAAGVAARQTALMANELGRIAAGLAPDCSMTAHVSPSVGAGLIESATCLFISGVQYQDPAQRLWTINRLRDIARLTGWQTAVSIATGCETSWVKTFEAGRGPPYTRTAEERVQRDIWTNGRRVDRATQDRDGNNELVISKTNRVYYALGILGLENDFEKLDFADWQQRQRPKEEFEEFEEFEE